MAKSHPSHPTPPGLWLFLAALRWQESGSPAGNYTEPNGQGAYQIIQSNWPTWARSCAGYKTTDPNASNAPKAVQDQVAKCMVSRYYYGEAQKSWRLVARKWNGGSVDPVPNPALCAGCTTDTYADQLLHKADVLRAQGYKAPKVGGPTAAAGGGTAAAGATSTASAPGGCVHPLKISIPAAPDIHLCMDKPIAVVIGAAGGVLLLGGVLVVVVAMMQGTGAGRQLAGAAGVVTGPAGKAATLAATAGKAATPAARTARREQAAGDSARRLAPVRAAESRQRSEQRTVARQQAAEARRAASAASMNTARETRARAQLAKASTRPVTKNYYLEPPPRGLTRADRPVLLRNLDPNEVAPF